MTAKIEIDASRQLGPVPKFVFGQNIEAAEAQGIFPSGTQLRTLSTGNGFWDPATGKTLPEVAARVRAAGVTMLRYPGGCLAHGFDWRKAVGPVEKRSDANWKYGLDEFLASCAEFKAEPMITVSDYVLPAEEMPAHVAELVEYLNSPATPEHPWAMKRAEWGHPEPYGVKWFELGNESDHGNHNIKPRRVFTPEQYANYAVSTAKAMKAVDPSIKVGILMEPGTGQEVNSDWNRTVARIAGPAADFVILHFYTPHVTEAALKMPGRESELMEAAMAVPDQVAAHLHEYREMIRQECGRELPFAITEFNMGAIPDKPKPYRYSFGAALQCADMIRVFLQPSSHVEAAQYWQFINGHWGMLKSPEANPSVIRENPAFLIYQLWGSHFGSTLVQTTVKSPRGSIMGFPGVYQAEGPDHDKGGKQVGAMDSAAIRPFFSQETLQADNVSLSEDGVLTIKLDRQSRKQYPVIATIPRPQDSQGALTYTLSYEARFVGEGKPAKVSIGMMDSRGYDKTGSAAQIAGATEPEWKTYSGEFRSLPDASAVKLVARIEDETGLSGSFEIRNLNLHLATAPRFPSYPLLTATASLGANKEILYLIVINKSATDAIDAAISLQGFDAASGKIWQVSAPSFVDGAAGFTESGASVSLAPEGFPRTFPARSMTAIEIYRKNP